MIPRRIRCASLLCFDRPVRVYRLLCSLIPSRLVVCHDHVCPPVGRYVPAVTSALPGPHDTLAATVTPLGSVPSSPLDRLQSSLGFHQRLLGGLAYLRTGSLPRDV